MATQSISNSDDVIDSRDIIERIEYLSAYDYMVCADCGCTFGDEHEEGCSQPFLPADNLTEEDKEELTALLALQDECEGISEWKYGTPLIRDSYFETYAENLAGELYEIHDHWPFTCIDWEKAAEELQYDYTYVNFGDETYWIRNV
jgi:hypothetical protein